MSADIVGSHDTRTTENFLRKKFAVAGFSLGGEGNALYPVLCSFCFYFACSVPGCVDFGIVASNFSKAA